MFPQGGQPLQNYLQSQHHSTTTSSQPQTLLPNQTPTPDRTTIFNINPNPDPYPQLQQPPPSYQLPTGYQTIQRRQQQTCQGGQIQPQLKQYSNNGYQQRDQKAQPPSQIIMQAEELIEKLNGSKASIKTTAAWFVTLPQYAETFMDLILGYAKNAVQFEKQIHLIYLINDILLKNLMLREQVEVWSRDVFATAVQQIAGELFKVVYNKGLTSGIGDVKDRLIKILDFWSERQVFDARNINVFKFIMDPSGQSSNDKGQQVVQQQQQPAQQSQPSQLQQQMVQHQQQYRQYSQPSQLQQQQQQQHHLQQQYQQQQVQQQYQQYQKGYGGPMAYLLQNNVYPHTPFLFNESGFRQEQMFNPQFQYPHNLPQNVPFPQKHTPLQPQMSPQQQQSAQFQSMQGVAMQKDPRQMMQQQISFQSVQQQPIPPPQMGVRPPVPMYSLVPQGQRVPVQQNPNTPQVQFMQQQQLLQQQQTPQQKKHDITLFSFPAGLIPKFIKRQLDENDPPYTPIDPEDIKKEGMPKIPKMDPYLQSRVDRFYAELNDYRPGMQQENRDRGDRGKRSGGRERRELEGDQGEGAEQRGSIDPKTRMRADGSFVEDDRDGRERSQQRESKQSRSSSQYAGLGSKAKQEEDDKDEDQFSMFRRLRSGYYHQSMAAAQRASRKRQG